VTTTVQPIDTTPIAGSPTDHAPRERNRAPRVDTDLVRRWTLVLVAAASLARRAMKNRAVAGTTGPA